MAEYVLGFHGGHKFETPEEGAKHMAKWRAWVEATGDAMVNPGMPLGMSKTVNSGGVSDTGGSNPLSGVAVVRADNMDAALAIAKGCPHVDIGTIEVAEVMVMPS